MHKYVSIAIFLCCQIAFVSSQLISNPSFDFKRYLFGEPPSLNVFVNSLNSSTGQVVISGGDYRSPSIPFTWDWGDGSVNDGWFPQGHTYSDLTKNYILKVTAHYSDGTADCAEIIIRFVSPIISPVSLLPGIAVSIPASDVTLTSRMPGYGIPGSLTYFDDSFFDIISRSTTEYILTVAAAIQKDLVNDDVYLIDGGFNQVLLRYPSFGGMCSLWYTSPVSFGVGDYGFQGTIQWSSFIHEMGHNFTLNSPADYYYGGKIDGCANAVYSESMAQIFQHATAYEIINNASAFGLSEDIVADIKQSAISSIRIVRNSYEDYVNSGKNFASWNDPNTPQDDTFNTFMTIAYQFFVHAENSGHGYRQPLKRMMRLLQVLNEDLRQRYDQHHNTAKADTFRATLMTTAVAYGFDEDLRNEFRSLNFPISDEIYEMLIELANTTQIDVNSGQSDIIPDDFMLFQNFPNPFNPATKIQIHLSKSCDVTVKIFDTNGRKVALLIKDKLPAGTFSYDWNAEKLPSGIYLYCLQAGSFVKTKKLILLK